MVPENREENKGERDTAVDSRWFRVERGLPAAVATERFMTMNVAAQCPTGDFETAINYRLSTVD
jgi:hypothetical protein